MTKDSVSDRCPAVTVEYDNRGKRVTKTFDDGYSARRLYVQKDKEDKNPKVLAASPDNTDENPVVLTSAAMDGGKGANTQDPAKPVVGAYIRVSTVGQNEDGQRAEVERWMTGNGVDMEFVQWFVDKKSGDNLKRPAFKKLQEAVFNGKIETIVCYKLDRLSRKLCEGLNTLADWCDRGVRVVATSQQIDFNGTVGKMLAAVLLGIAEMEQENRRERQAAGIAEAKRKGKYKGRKLGTTKANPARAQELRRKGLTISEIANSLNISHVTVHKYLKPCKQEEH